MMNPVELLQAWYQHQSGREGRNRRFDFTMDSQRKSARLDVDGDAALGRATVWENGMCDIEVIDADAGAQLMYLHIEVTCEDDLNRGISEMIKRTIAGS